MPEYNPFFESGEVFTEADGGKHSLLPCDFTLVPARALAEVANVSKEGAEKYAIDNWRGIPLRAHTNHALRHLYHATELMRTGGDRLQIIDEFRSAATRALYCLETYIEDLNNE